jgi:hypothetical protein
VEKNLDTKYSVDELVDIFDKWIDKISKNNDELGGFAICPYAQKAYDDGKVWPTRFYKDYNKAEVLNRIDILFKNNKDVLIFVYMGNEPFTDEELLNVINDLQAERKDLIFLKDHPDNPGFIQKLNTGNEVVPLFLVQKKTELLDAREKLKKTKYYSYWSEEYKNEIWSYGNES